jgi:peptidyl-prolyl cis-trans isomerase A (cyclophilin A)/peptidyl-prolyl cis-trans isomerase B (cyclophilin B)
MLRRALLILALVMPAFALAQTGTTPAKPAAKAPAKTAPAKAKAAEPAVSEADKTASKVLIKTNLGEMTVELYPDKAPKSVENFLAYVNGKFYDGTIFHRVIDNFMIQGGGFTPELRQKATRPAIANEAKNGLSNSRGTLAMARTGDPNSATAQFFINVADNKRLDFRSPDPQGYGYTVFGKVVAGMDVVARIAKSRTGPGGPFPTDVPVERVIIKSARIINAAG